MNEKTLIRDLTQGNPMKQLLSFSFPFILANLLQQAYNITDMVIVGQFVGSAGLAAASAGGELAMMFLFFAMGFCSAGQIIISQHIGAKERERVSSTIGTMMTFNLSLAAVFTVLSLLICDWLISVIQVPSEAVQFAHDYCTVYYIGMIPVFGYNVVSSILRGMGDSKHPFIFVAIAAVLNVILDLIFVGPLHMACFGAALATIISQTVSFVIALIFLYRNRARMGFDFGWKDFIPDKKELGAMVRLGIPLSIQSFAVSIDLVHIYLIGKGDHKVYRCFTLVRVILTAGVVAVSQVRCVDITSLAKYRIRVQRCREEYIYYRTIKRFCNLFTTPADFQLKRMVSTRCQFIVFRTE